VSDRISAKKTVVVRASVSVSTIFGGVFRAAKADKRENEAGWTGGGKRRQWANEATMGRVARHESNGQDLR
jgi:hypothetical protein